MNSGDFTISEKLSLETLRRGAAELRRITAAAPPERVLYLPGWCLERHPELCEQARLAYGFDRVAELVGPVGVAYESITQDISRNDWERPR